MDGSELILNERGAIYHIDLKPGELAKTILTVGDPERVKMISGYFDKIHLSRAHREFHTITGEYNGSLLSVISTGIGTDNIDIVLSEIDAIFNIDMDSKQPKEHFEQLSFIRLGTSGALHPEVRIGDLVLSKFSVGLDNLLHFYEQDPELRLEDLEKKVEQSIGYKTYAFGGNMELLSSFSAMGKEGITFSCPGFYGPQGRGLRLKPKVRHYLEKLQRIKFKDTSATNFEMETSGIYGLSQLMGHRALSISTILANRTQGTFSKKPAEHVKGLIEKTLETIARL